MFSVHKFLFRCRMLFPLQLPRSSNYYSQFTSTHIISRVLLAVVVVATLADSEGIAQELDPYLRDALKRIEQSLVHPPDSYGVEVLDTYQMDSVPALKKLGKIKEGYGIYVDGGDAQYRRERYPIRGDRQKPYTSMVALDRKDADLEIAVKFNDRHTLRKGKMQHKEGLTSYSIGQIDPYTWWADADERGEHPDESPFQILANPTIAPLDLTPEVIRGWDIEEQPSEGKLKIYEAVGEHPEHQGKIATLRLYFATDRDGVLARTDFQVHAVGSDEPLFREVRAVNSWQVSASGQHVPAEYTCTRITGGKKVSKLTRKITAVKLNSVDPSRFQRDAIPEFQVTFDEVEDIPAIVKAIEEGHPLGRDGKKQSGANLQKWLLALNLIVLVGVILFVIVRFFRKRKALRRESDNV